MHLQFLIPNTFVAVLQASLNTYTRCLVSLRGERSGEPFFFNFWLLAFVKPSSLLPFCSPSLQHKRVKKKGPPFLSFPLLPPPTARRRGANNLGRTNLLLLLADLPRLAVARYGDLSPSLRRLRRPPRRRALTGEDASLVPATAAAQPRLPGARGFKDGHARRHRHQVRRRDI